MITRIQSNNNKTTNFCALKSNPIKLGQGAQNILAKAGDFSSVHQRLAIGASALLIQPFIDLKNKEVDKDTKKVSAARSAAKAIIGTATGLVVRSSCMKLAELKYAQKDAAGNIIKEAGKIKIDPQKVKRSFGEGFEALKLDEKALSDAIKRVPSVVGTIAALGVMVLTNFLIDAPLTNLTMEKIDKFMEKRLNSKKTTDKTQESAGEQNG